MRLLLAYVVIPLFVPALFTLGIQLNGGYRLDPRDYINSLSLIGTITFAAMVVLGLPLLLIYFRLKLTSLLAFAAGGGLCAAITGAVLGGSAQVVVLCFYGVIGAAAGLVLRVILLGARPGERGQNCWPRVRRRSS